ncbi:MAG TPA: hypothetical protein PKZ84_19810 [Anaerolineae bacterium]|nr:hypothetical protein [Anaerolineae bacterium]HQI87429.1 hypothetical protein [Anaerolineae bacterium]
MKHKSWIVLIVTVLMIVSLACNAGRTTPTPEPPTVAPTEAPTATPEPTATPNPTATPEPTATTAPTATPAPTEVVEEGLSLEITNQSSRDIWYVFISPSDADDWGDDWLAGDIIPAGESYTIAGIPAGVYDLQAEDENGGVIETLWEVDIAEDSYWTVVGGASLEVVNNSTEIIAALYVSPSDSDSWGEDWLGDVALKSGGSHVIEGLENDVSYDVKAEDANGNTIETIYNVSVVDWYTWYVVGKTDLPTNAVLRFEDDFSDNRNHWAATRETDDVYYIPPKDGQYCILIKATDLTAWEWYEPFRPDQFVAEVACTPDEGTDATCGIGFGPDGDNLYWFEVAPEQQSFALFLLKDDEWQEAPIDWTESKNIVPTGWNYLSIERTGGYFSVFVNGVMLGQVESNIFPTGRIGIGGASYDDGNVTVCLDDLRVWRIEK